MKLANVRLCTIIMQWLRTQSSSLSDVIDVAIESPTSWITIIDVDMTPLWLTSRLPIPVSSTVAIHWLSTLSLDIKVKTQASCLSQTMVIYFSDFSFIDIISASKFPEPQSGLALRGSACRCTTIDYLCDQWCVWPKMWWFLDNTYLRAFHVIILKKSTQVSEW